MVYSCGHRNQHVVNFEIPPFSHIRSVVHLLHRMLIVGCFYVLTYPDCKFKRPKALDSDGCKNLSASTLSA
ncbi:hypothetical protein DK530_01015 [Salmonella enterica]|nr:hypothetical protein [Salmonella enterica]